LQSPGCVNITEATMEEYDTEVNPPLVLPNIDGQVSFQATGCLFPAYLIAFAIVFLFSVSLLPYLGSWVKFLILLIVIAINVTLIFVNPLKQVLNCTERLLSPMNDDDR